MSMKDDVISDALEELRGRLPIELHRFYELFRKRTGCGAVLNPSSDYQYLELGPSASLEFFDKRVLIVFCGDQGEEKREVELRKVLVIDYRKYKGLKHDSYLLYYEVPRF
jgi:hypothetical protein